MAFFTKIMTPELGIIGKGFRVGQKKGLQGSIRVHRGVIGGQKQYLHL